MNALRWGATASLRMLACGLSGLLGLSAAATETGSPQYRLVGPAPASTASVSTSPLQRLRWIGGSGQPVGIAASLTASTNSGGASLQLPTHRIFRDGLED